MVVGWCSRDPDYIRLAKLGVHAGLASLVLGRPYNPAWPDAEIAAYFKAIKAGDLLLYDRCKRTVHGTNYGLTEFGMVRNFPQVFPTIQIARKFKKLYAEMAPALPKWHTEVRERAYQQNYLGGPGDHPYGYKHWFWDVIGFRQIPYSVYLKRQKARDPVTIIQGKYYAITLGGDAKRVVAFYPQSIAAGVLKEAMLRLFAPESPSWIGDAYYGRTPLRAPIHDSLLMEIPTRVWDRVVERVYREMMRPVEALPLDWVSPADRQRLGFGPLLTIGVEGKAGLDWQKMEKIPGPTLQELGLSGESVYFPADEDAESAEDVASLGTVA